MSPLERLHAAVTFQKCDRPPFSDNEWPDLFPDLIPRLAKCPVRDDGRYSEDERVAAVRASLDMVPWHQLYAGARYPILGPIPPERCGRVEGDDGITRVVHNGVRWVEERPFRDLHGAIEHLKGMLRSVHDSRPVLSEDFPDRLQCARSKFGGVCIAFPYTPVGLDDLYPRFSWNLFAMMTIEADDLIAEYLSALADSTVARISLMAQHITASDCPVVLVYSDIAHNGGLLLSPAFLQKTLLPAFQKIAEAYHQHGIKVVYHSEGDLHKILPDLIAAGADGINPVSPAENMDPVSIRKAYPNLVLWGGIDNCTLLVKGTTDDVEREVHRVSSGVGTGLILGSSGGVHPACKVKNCIAMVETLKTMEQEKK